MVLRLRFSQVTCDEYVIGSVDGFELVPVRGRFGSCSFNVEMVDSTGLRDTEGEGTGLLSCFCSFCWGSSADEQRNNWRRTDPLETPKSRRQVD